MNTISQIQTPFLQDQFIPKAQADKKVEGFSEMLKQQLENVNQSQKASDVLTNQLAAGEAKDIHEVMITSQKASLSLQLTTQVRNKVVEAYQEIMRMQV
ncbi:flagellar hook-basal body complex protein FliE [Planococcus salinus]|uniref:Flagellar hook-basal body complex protein FliE n=1 Tax=Planococcus salinus TaxID=1848460 RepID=A0A3M8P4Z1_9BACL|nr:flagellar hook-basal body complex protein FliE [Planococcus salinus]RNF38758.1 flagellar hook-basal body complex protein FliE [Planococcus salinus]